MNRLLIAFLALITFSSAHAAQYNCAGFADVEEYRSSIDLAAKTADFFDNDTTIDMTLVKTEFLESIPFQTRYIFESQDTGLGVTRLYFTTPSLSATLIEEDHEGEVTEVGTVTCTSVK